MRWWAFLVVVLAGLMLQTTVLQALWLPTPIGWVGPEILAAVALFVSFSARSGTDAALAGWAIGMAVDLTLSGEGMGLLSLLYAVTTAGLFHARKSFLPQKMLTQMLLGGCLCLAVYECWAVYELLLTGAPGWRWGERTVQVLGMSAYTGLLAPPVWAGLKRMQRWLVAPASALRERR